MIAHTPFVVTKTFFSLSHKQLWPRCAPSYNCVTNFWTLRQNFTTTVIKFWPHFGLFQPRELYVHLFSLAKPWWLLANLCNIKIVNHRSKLSFKLMITLNELWTRSCGLPTLLPSIWNQFINQLTSRLLTNVNSIIMIQWKDFLVSQMLCLNHVVLFWCVWNFYSKRKWDKLETICS